MSCQIRKQFCKPFDSRRHSQSVSGLMAVTPEHVDIAIGRESKNKNGEPSEFSLHQICQKKKKLFFFVVFMYNYKYLRLTNPLIFFF